MLKILTIIGARPQFVKAATVSRAFRSRTDIREVIVHTGQHFDLNMSQVFFEQLEIPTPTYNLGISSLTHGSMTGRMAEAIEKLIILNSPHWILLYGDTNSTLAGAIAAAKLGVPIAHVEAGLRTHDLSIPEEVNRVLTDRVSTLLLCPTKRAVNNLRQEGFPFRITSNGHQRIENIGDVMFDAVLHYRKRVQDETILDKFCLNTKDYVLCTLHRQENTNYLERFTEILSALREISRFIPVIFPVHPRTKGLLLELFGDAMTVDGIRFCSPVSYFQMQSLEMNARCILTDSGGIQKEAFFHGVPCITLRDETEWVETVEAGGNFLVGSSHQKIISTFHHIINSAVNYREENLFGDGHAATKVADLLAALS